MLVAAGCGGDDDDGDAADTTTTPTTVAATPTPTTGAGTGTSTSAGGTAAADPATLTTQTLAVVGGVIETSRALAEDPGSADERLRQLRIQALALQGLAGQALDDQPELQDALTSANEQLAEAASQLQDAGNSEEVQQVIDDQVAPAADSVRKAAAEQLDTLPDDVQDNLDQAREQLQELQRELPSLGG